MFPYICDGLLSPSPLFHLLGRLSTERSAPGEVEVGERVKDKGDEKERDDEDDERDEVIEIHPRLPIDRVTWRIIFGLGCLMG